MHNNVRLYVWFFFVVVALNDFEWGAFNLKQRHAKF